MVFLGGNWHAFHVLLHFFKYFLTYSYIFMINFPLDKNIVIPKYSCNFPHVTVIRASFPYFYFKMLIISLKILESMCDFLGCPHTKVLYTVSRLCYFLQIIRRMSLGLVWWPTPLMSQWGPRRLKGTIQYFFKFQVYYWYNFWMQYIYHTCLVQPVPVV